MGAKCTLILTSNAVVSNPEYLGYKHSFVNNICVCVCEPKMHHCIIMDLVCGSLWSLSCIRNWYFPCRGRGVPIWNTFVARYEYI